MEVTYIGHAAMMLEAKGKRVLMDPWLKDPAYHGTWWHYPPLAIGVEDLPPIDYLYVSHEHQDHFDPPTLERLDKNVRVIIAKYQRKRLRQRLEAIGFHDIVELDFDSDYACGDGGLVVRLIPPDRAWDDSAILLRDGEHTVLNVNDCHLDAATLDRVGRTYDIDLAFLTFTGASQYPNCFDFSLGSKQERASLSKRSHLEEFVNWAKRLRTKRAVPAAGNFALLAEDQLFMNHSWYANTPAEAVEALRAGAPEIEPLQMNPGDRWTPEGGLKRLNPPPDWNRRMEDIERMSREVRPLSDAYFASEPAAGAHLFDRFERYFRKQLESDPQVGERIGIVVAWNVTGPDGGDWYIDFPRRHIERGVPENWNLRISIPDKLVALGVDEKAIWDDIILSFRVRLARRPDRYMKEFWTWFCKL